MSAQSTKAFSRSCQVFFFSRPWWSPFQLLAGLAMLLSACEEGLLQGMTVRSTLDCLEEGRGAETTNELSDYLQENFDKDGSGSLLARKEIQAGLRSAKSEVDRPWAASHEHLMGLIGSTRRLCVCYSLEKDEKKQPQYKAMRRSAHRDRDKRLKSFVPLYASLDSGRRSSRSCAPSSGAAQGASAQSRSSAASFSETDAAGALSSSTMPLPPLFSPELRRASGEPGWGLEDIVSGKQSRRRFARPCAIVQEVLGSAVQLMPSEPFPLLEVV